MVKKEQEETFEAILKLYDLAEELLDTIDENAAHADEHYQKLEPFIEELAEAADILSREYTELAKEGKTLDAECRKNLENTLKKIFLVLEEMKKLDLE